LPAGRRHFLRRLAVFSLFAVLFLAGFLLTVAYTLSGETVLSLVRPALKSRNVDIAVDDARFVFPIGMRLSGVTVTVGRNPPIPLDEVTASWEWTGLFQWLPARVRIVRGNATAEIRLSPAAWNPSRGRVTLAGLSSEEIPLPVFSESGAGFSVRRFDARWSGSGGKLTAKGTGAFEYLQIPVPAPQSPIREAKIDNVSITFVVRGDVLHVPRVQGIYEGSRVDGTGEISRFLVPKLARVTFHLRIMNPFEGGVGMLFDMLAKNAKNANLRVVGSLAAPKAEFQFF
jgi:hypothetical protein